MFTTMYEKRTFFYLHALLLCWLFVFSNHLFSQSFQKVILLDNFASSSQNALGGEKGVFAKYHANCTISMLRGNQAFDGTGNTLELEYNVNPDSSFCGYFSKFNNLDLSAFNYLSFWIKGGKGGEFFRIQLTYVLNKDTVRAKVSAWDYLPKGPTTVWQKVVIPLDSFYFLPNRTCINELAIVFEHYQSEINNSPFMGTVYVDDFMIGTFHPGYVKIDHFDDKFAPNALGGNVGIFSQIKNDVAYSCSLRTDLYHENPNGLICSFDKSGPSTFGGVSFIFGDGATKCFNDISRYEFLHFWAKAIDEATNPVEFKIELISLNSENILDTLYTARPISDLTSEYKEYNLQLSTFRVLWNPYTSINLKKVGQFNVVFEDFRIYPRGPGHVVFDDIEFRTANCTYPDKLLPPIASNLRIAGQKIEKVLKIYPNMQITLDLQGEDLTRLESISIVYREKDQVWKKISRQVGPFSATININIDERALPTAKPVEMKVVTENYNGKQQSSASFTGIVEDLVYSGENLFKQSFQLFQELRNDIGVYRDGSRFEGQQFHPASVAAIGMGLISLCIADTMDWIDNAEELALQTLQAMTGKKPPFKPAKNLHGFFRHFINMKTGVREWNSEFSTIDTGILISGAFFCKNYFNSSLEIGNLADTLYCSVNWDKAIADPKSGGIFLDMDSLGTGKNITLPFNEYMIVAWLAKNDPKNNARANELWANYYIDPAKLPKKMYRNIELLTDSPSHYLSDFVFQFPYYLCNYYTTNLAYLVYHTNAMLADKMWWRDSTTYPEYIWGFGAGAAPTSSGYNADNISEHPGTVCSPHIIAGFIPIAPEAIDDLLLMHNDALGIYNLQDSSKTKILWRFRPENTNWRAADVQGVDFSTMLFGLASHPQALGSSFFAKFNNFNFPTKCTTVKSINSVSNLSKIMLTNHPNPFNSETTICFTIPFQTKVSIFVYNLHGQLIRQLENDKLYMPGNYLAKWNGVNDQGALCSSGAYFCRLFTTDFNATIKTIFIK